MLIVIIFIHKLATSGNNNLQRFNKLYLSEKYPTFASTLILNYISNDK